MSDKRNIQTIAPFLADNFVDLEEPIFDRDEYSKMLKHNSARLGLFEKYLICKLHDSWVIELTHDLDSLKITLNDFSTHVFADAIVDERFGVMAAEARRNGSANLKVCTPLEVQWKPPLRQAAIPLGVMPESASDNTVKI